MSLGPWRQLLLCIKYFNKTLIEFVNILLNRLQFRFHLQSFQIRKTSRDYFRAYNMQNCFFFSNDCVFIHCAHIVIFSFDLFLSTDSQVNKKFALCFEIFDIFDKILIDIESFVSGLSDPLSTVSIAIEPDIFSFFNKFFNNFLDIFPRIKTLNNMLDCIGHRCRNDS